MLWYWLDTIATVCIALVSCTNKMRYIFSIELEFISCSSFGISINSEDFRHSISRSFSLYVLKAKQKKKISPFVYVRYKCSCIKCSMYFICRLHFCTLFFFDEMMRTLVKKTCDCNTVCTPFAPIRTIKLMLGANRMYFLSLFISVSFSSIFCHLFFSYFIFLCLLFVFIWFATAELILT